MLVPDLTMACIAEGLIRDGSLALAKIAQRNAAELGGMQTAQGRAARGVLADYVTRARVAERRRAQYERLIVGPKGDK